MRAGRGRRRDRRGSRARAGRLPSASLLPRSRRTSSRRSSSRHADGSRRRRITSGCTTSGRHSATALRTHAVEPTTGQTHPSRHAATAGSPVARLRPRTISVSQSSSGRGPPTRPSRPFERLLAETRSPYVLLSRAWLLAMLDRSEEAWQDAREAYARLASRATFAGPTGGWPSCRSSTATTRTRATVCASSATGSRRRISSCTSRTTWGAWAVHCACLAASTKRRRPPSARDRLKRSSVPRSRRTTAGARCWPASTRTAATLAEAERLAREAVAVSERTDLLNEQCLALWDLGEVLAAAGRPDDAAAAFEQALDRCQRKKNLALARQVRERLAELRAETQPAP